MKKQNSTSSERYVLKCGENVFVRHIHWIAGGVLPNSIATGSFDQALILSSEYLDYTEARADKSRKSLLMEKFPDIEMIPVKITIL